MTLRMKLALAIIAALFILIMWVTLEPCPVDRVWVLSDSKWVCVPKD